MTLYNELTPLGTITHTQNVDSAQHYFVSGWMELSSHIKQRILELRENTMEQDTMAKLDILYKFCQEQEKLGFHHMPTVISEKK